MDIMDPSQPTPNIPVQPTPQPFTPKTPRSIPKFIFIIGGLIIILSGIFGGYFLVKSNFKPPQKGCTLEAKLCPDGSSVGRTGPNCEFAPCPQVTVVPSSNLDSTTNWKTYTSANYNYSIRYPNNWFIQDLNDRVFLGESENVDNSHYKISLSIDRKAYENLKNILSQSEKEYISFIQVDGKESIKRKVMSLVLPTGYKWIGELPSANAYILQERAYELLIPLGDNTLRIYGFLDTKDIVDQILSTLKFLDNTQASKLRICPDDWIQNKQPGTVGEKYIPREYFIIAGKRRELEELDTEWITSNCNVNQPRIVQ